MENEDKLKDLIEERFGIVDRVSAVVEKLKAEKKELDNIDERIAAVIEEPVTQARKLGNKETGTVDVLVQGVMVKHNIQKKVDWDQEKLGEVKKRILAHNDNPDDYMETKTKTTYNVLEKKFKKFPAAVKAVFEEARTVTTGKPKVTFDLDWR